MKSPCVRFDKSCKRCESDRTWFENDYLVLSGSLIKRCCVRIQRCTHFLWMRPWYIISSALTVVWRLSGSHTWSLFIPTKARLSVISRFDIPFSLLLVLTLSPFSLQLTGFHSFPLLSPPSHHPPPTPHHNHTHTPSTNSEVLVKLFASVWLV